MKNLERDGLDPTFQISWKFACWKKSQKPAISKYNLRLASRGFISRAFFVNNDDIALNRYR